MKEQRVTNRFGCSHLVHYSDARTHSVGMVTDVSLDGARMSCQSPLEVGSPVELLSLDSNGAALPIPCEVRWYRPVGPEAGLRFSQPVGELLQTWVGDVLTRAESRPAHLVQRRHVVRVPVEFRVTVGEGQPEVEAELIDLSESGALLRTHRMWATETELELDIPDLGKTLTASVVSGRHSDEAWHYSLRFVDLTSSTRDELRELVRGQL